MNNQEILKKAIKKAIENGWKRDGKSLIEWITEEDEQWSTLLDAQGLDTILFSHDFARAFWGEEKLASCTDCFLLGFSAPRYCPKCLRAWMHQLQQLVLAEDRLAYINQFLDA